MRRAVGQHERHGLAGGDLEIADRREVLAAQRDGGVQRHQVGPGDGAHGAVRQSRDPRHRPPVVEAQDQLGAHRDAAALAADDPDDVGVAAPRRHEVHHGDGAARRLDPRLEDQRVAAIAAGDARAVLDRRDRPASVLAIAEQRGKARRRVEARPAQPVDRSGARDQRRGLAVANQRVVFEGGAHGRSRRVQAGSYQSTTLPFLKDFVFFRVNVRGSLRVWNGVRPLPSDDGGEHELVLVDEPGLGELRHDAAAAEDDQIRAVGGLQRLHLGHQVALEHGGVLPVRRVEGARHHVLGHRVHRPWPPRAASGPPAAWARRPSSARR